MSVQCKKRSASERSGKEDLMVFPKKSKVRYERGAEVDNYSYRLLKHI